MFSPSIQSLSFPNLSLNTRTRRTQAAGQQPLSYRSMTRLVRWKTQSFIIFDQLIIMFLSSQHLQNHHNMIRNKHTDDNDDKNPQEVISSHPDAITLFAVLLLALLLAPATIPGQVGIN